MKRLREVRIQHLNNIQCSSVSFAPNISVRKQPNIIQKQITILQHLTKKLRLQSFLNLGFNHS